MIEFNNRLYAQRFEIFRDGLIVVEDWSRAFTRKDKLIAISFRNNGANQVLLNGQFELLADGSMLSFKSEMGVYDLTKYEIRFVGSGDKRVEIHYTFESNSFAEESEIQLLTRI